MHARAKASWPPPVLPSHGFMGLVRRRISNREFSLSIDCKSYVQFGLISDVGHPRCSLHLPITVSCQGTINPELPYLARERKHPETRPQRELDLLLPPLSSSSSSEHCSTFLLGEKDPLLFPTELIHHVRQSGQIDTLLLLLHMPCIHMSGKLVLPSIWAWQKSRYAVLWASPSSSSSSSSSSSNEAARSAFVVMLKYKSHLPRSAAQTGGKQAGL
jgi:hypothetical protein